MLKKIVNDTLNRLDVVENVHEEQQQWSWSRIFQIIKGWPLPNVHGSMWAHIEQEWMELESILLSNTNTKPRSP